MRPSAILRKANVPGSSDSTSCGMKSSPYEVARGLSGADLASKLSQFGYKQTRQTGSDLRLKRLLKTLATLRFRSIFTADCPHCDTGSTAFTILGEPRQSMGGQARYTFGICGSCKGGVVLEIVLVSLEGDVDVTARAVPRPHDGHHENY